MKAVKITVYQHGWKRTLEIWGVQFPSGMIRAGQQEYVIHNYGATSNPSKRELMIVKPTRQKLCGQIKSIEILK